MIENAAFRPAWWLRGPHRQTLWAALARRKPEVALRRERIELPDGDFIDLDWTDGADAGAGDSPLIIVVHGLEGSSKSGYARGILAAAVKRKWRGVVMHFRGCSGEPNRLARSYNAGDTDDFDFLIKILRQREAQTKIAAVAYSLGGNMLLKWLGENGYQAPLDAAAAVCVPFLLETAALRMQRGLSRIYQYRLLHDMRASYRRKFGANTLQGPVDPGRLGALDDFFKFDDKVTAPLHGYEGVEDYYRRASCRQYLKYIAIPTLILHARDDPFMLPRAIPEAEELAPSIRLELSRYGGHVGFVEGVLPWRPRYWLEQRIPDFLESCF